MVLRCNQGTLLGTVQHADCRAEYSTVVHTVLCTDTALHTVHSTLHCMLGTGVFGVFDASSSLLLSCRTMGKKRGGGKKKDNPGTADDTQDPATPAQACVQDMPH